jgi:hypothetical protein
MGGWREPPSSVAVMLKDGEEPRVALSGAGMRSAEGRCPEGGSQAAALSKKESQRASLSMP